MVGGGGAVCLPTGGIEPTRYAVREGALRLVRVFGNQYRAYVEEGIGPRRAIFEGIKEARQPHEA